MSEAQDAVSSINDKLYRGLADEKGDLDGDIEVLTSLEYHSTGTSEWVEFLGRSIWDDQNDERPEDELAQDGRMPIEAFLIAEMHNVIATLQRVMDINLESA